MRSLFFVALISVSVSIHEIEKHTCNISVLRLILDLPEDYKPEKEEVTSEMRTYCRYLSHTCCKEKEFKTMQSMVREYSERIDTLVQSTKELISDVAKADKGILLGLVEQYGGQAKFGVTNGEELEKVLALAISNDFQRKLQIYISQQKQFYKGAMCSMCSSKEGKYMTLNTLKTSKGDKTLNFNEILADHKNYYFDFELTTDTCQDQFKAALIQKPFFDFLLQLSDIARMIEMKEEISEDQSNILQLELGDRDFEDIKLCSAPEVESRPANCLSVCNWFSNFFSFQAPSDILRSIEMLRYTFRIIKQYELDDGAKGADQALKNLYNARNVLGKIQYPFGEKFEGTQISIRFNFKEAGVDVLGNWVSKIAVGFIALVSLIL